MLVALCPICFWKGLVAHGLIPVHTVKYQSGPRVLKHMLYALLAHGIGNGYKGTAAFYYPKFHSNIFHGFFQLYGNQFFFLEPQCF